MCGFCSLTTLPHSIFLYPSKKLLPALMISSHMEENQSMHHLKSLKQKTLSL